MKPENFGKNLKSIRLFLKQTLSYVSNETGLTEACLSQIENSKRLPSLESIIKILNHFGCTFERMMR